MKQRGREIPAPAPRAGGARQKSKGKKKKSKAGRWYLGVENASLGPFSIKNFGIGSGTAPRDLQGQDVRTNEYVPGMQETKIHTRRERLGVVNGSTTYAVRSYPINPGNVNLFPWLSEIAPLYEKYRVRDMRFVFEQTGSGFAAPNQSGRVVLGCDYDVMSPDVASIEEAENKNPNVGFAPYESAVLRLDNTLITPEPKFTRGANYPAGGDPKTYDGGKLFVAVAGTPNANQIGVLYIEYDIEMITPQLPSAVGFQPDFHLAGFEWVPTTNLPNATLTDAPLQRFPGNAAGGLTLAVTAPASFNLAPGNWRVHGHLYVNNTTSQLSGLYIYLKKNGAPMRTLWIERSSGSTFSEMTGIVDYVIPSSSVADVYSFQLYATFAGGATTVQQSALYFEF
jgi:hypothetical protein